MTSDAGKMYFHVQRCSAPAFKVGRSYQFGAEENLFFRDLSTTELGLPIRGVGDMPVDAVLRDYFDESGFRHHLNVRLPNFHGTERELLGCALRVLTHQAILLRELVFEQVRTESFPSKPSRFRCVWLIPHEEQILDSWCATAPHGSFRAFEVEASGCFHHGASKYLAPACLNAGTLRDNARMFWSEPVDVLREPAEIMCVGEIRVVRKLEKGGSHDTVWKRLKRLF